MTEDPLEALQRHFEEQYGKIEVGVRKRRKLSHIEPESSTDTEEEWQGIQDDEEDNSPPTQKPQIVSFTETANITQTPDTGAKTFLVIRRSTNINDSPLKSPKQSLSRKSYRPVQRSPMKMTKQ
jgi:hypothetical protein